MRYAFGLIRFAKPVVLFCLLLLGFAPAAEDKRLTVYSPQANFSVAVVDHDSREYVSVTDLLDPFGRSSLVRDGNKWKLEFRLGGKQIKGEFNVGSNQGKIGGKKITLSAPFWAEGQRGFVPINSAMVVLSQTVGGNGVLRANSRRLFMNEVSTTYSMELQKGTAPKLLLHFSAPVNPSVATEPGRVRLTFTRDPVVAGGNPQKFDDPTIRSATFAEINGAAELTVTTSTPLLATFEDGGRTIALAAPASTAVNQLPLQPASPAVTANAPSGLQATPPHATPAAPARMMIVIDPAHGGDDAGATLASGLFEKEVTLGIARRLKFDLEQRGLAAVLLRDGDTTVTTDQRSIIANGSRAVAYVAIHAATLGSGVRVYTARFSASAPAGQTFLPWRTAQARYLNESRGVVASMTAEFQDRKIQSVNLEAGLEPLREIAKPAVVIEVAPPNGGSAEDLRKLAYQQEIAAAIGASIASMRGTLQTSEAALR